MTLYNLLTLCNDCYQEFKIYDVNDDGDIQDADPIVEGTADHIYEMIDTTEYKIESFNSGSNNDIIIWVFKPEGE